MKRLSLLASLVCGVLTGSAPAQETKSDPQDAKPQEEKKQLRIPKRVLQPFLWRIEGETPNYLFGTIHVSEPRALKLHPAAEEAFVESEAAYFEIDFRDQDAQKQQLAITLPPGEQLSDTLPSELISRLDARLAKVAPGNPNLRKDMRARPVVWPLLIQQFEALKRFPGPPLDYELFQRARASRKKVGGLEDPARQLDDLFKMKKEHQREFVRASLDAMDESDAEDEDQLMETIGYYLRGDAKAFHAYSQKGLEAGDLSKEVRDKLLEGLLYARNRRMAESIAKVISENPKRKHFFAVGTSHMLGEKTVLTYLARAKLKTTRIKVNATP